MRFKYQIILGRDDGDNGDDGEPTFFNSLAQRWSLPTWQTFTTKIKSPLLIFSLAFACCYLLAIFYCRWTLYNDPTSLFFDYRHAYEERYGAIRKEEARQLISLAASESFKRRSTDTPDICLGVPTIAREGKQYVHDAVGSMLHGLEDSEREQLQLIVFIAHTNPETHPIYLESWLDHLADKVLVYEDDIGLSELTQLRYFEENHMYLNKSLFDYTYLLRHCYDTGAAIVSIVEDDTVAVKGWFSGAMTAIEDIIEVEQPPHWLYLRMFYTEIYLGWEIQYWYKYVSWSTLVIILVVMPMIVARTTYPNLKRSLTNRVLGLMVMLTLFCIALFFSAGRLRLHPLHDGIQRMPRNGCCGQGMVFPREIVPAMIEYLDGQNGAYVDAALEIWADDNNFDRWVVVPSLLQHEGRKSSKGSWSDDVANASDPREIYNFRFEDYPATGLL